jgi:hypothetical protein
VLRSLPARARARRPPARLAGIAGGQNAPVPTRRIPASSPLVRRLLIGFWAAFWVVPFVVGVAFMIAGIVNGNAQHRNAQTTTAVVDRATPSCHRTANGSSTTCSWALYGHYTFAGATYQDKLVREGASSGNTGRTIDVLINPDHPDRVILLGPSRTVAFIVMGACFAVAAVVLGAGLVFGRRLLRSLTGGSAGSVSAFGPPPDRIN